MGIFAPSTRETEIRLRESYSRKYEKRLTVVEVTTSIAAEGEFRKSEGRDTRVNALEAAVAASRDAGVRTGRTAREVTVAAGLSP